MQEKHGFYVVSNVGVGVYITLIYCINGVFYNFIIICFLNEGEETTYIYELCDHYSIFYILNCFGRGKITFFYQLFIFISTISS